MVKVSVVIPVYNAEKYVKDAVQSILEQSFKEFELIIINDGSTDNSLEILLELEKSDSRIKLISRENRGLISTLNQGIELSQGSYLARMDADDVALPTRLEKQVEFLNTNSHVAVVGTGYSYINEHGIVSGNRNTFSEHEDILSSMFFGNPIAHPSVMVNSKLVGEDLFYDKNFPTVEDLELWIRLSRKYKLANINEILLQYRVLGESISGKNFQFQQEQAAKITSMLPPLDNNENGLSIAKDLYCVRENMSFLTFIKASFLLNVYNFKYPSIRKFSLLKRTFIANVLFWQKNIRKIH